MGENVLMQERERERERVRIGKLKWLASGIKWSDINRTSNEKEVQLKVLKI